MGDGLRQRIRQARFDSPAQEALLNLLVAADHVRREIDRVCARHDMTRGQYNVLRILRGVYPEGHPRGEISARMIERAPDVTRLTDRLEAQGLVERKRSAGDRRQSIAVITRQGLALLQRIDPEMASVERWWKERLSDRDSSELSRICEALYSQEIE